MKKNLVWVVARSVARVTPMDRLKVEREDGRLARYGQEPRRVFATKAEAVAFVIERLVYDARRGVKNAQNRLDVARARWAKYAPR